MGRFTVVIFILLLLSACANNLNKSVEGVGNFKPHISHDSSKRFSYTFYVFVSKDKTNHSRGSNQPRQQDSQQRRGSNQGGRGQGQNKSQNGQGGAGRGGNQGQNQSEQSDKMKAVLLYHLNKEFEKNEYCRKGYFELEYTFLNNNATFEGECNEGASDSDKAKWGRHTPINNNQLSSF